MSLPTEARLKALLHYDSETGVFRWKVRRGGAAQVGSVAGRIESKGYRQITHDGVCHRLGGFATAEAAHQAHLKAKKSIHTHNERALHHAAI